MPTTLTPDDLKRHGQQLSIDDLLAADDDTFMDAVRSIPEGREFSLNDFRRLLDDADVPPKQRAALMAAACARGLAEKVVLDVGGVQYPKKVKSTGRSAHGAHVQVYRRPVSHPEGR